MSRSRSSRPRLVLAALIAVALVPAAGCGVRVAGDADAGPGTTTTTTPPTAEPPPDRSGQAGTELLERAVERTASERRKVFEAEASVVAPSGEEELRAAGEIDLQVPRAIVELEQSVGTVELRLDGTDAWLRSDIEEIAEELPRGKDYVHVTKADDLEGIDFEFERELSSDLVFWLNGAEDVLSTGTDSVEGDPVRVFTFAAADDVVDRAPPERRDAVREAIEATGDAELEVTGEVAIDGALRVRRLRLEGVITPDDDGPPSVRGEEITITWDLEVSSYGEPVEVSPPPAASVAELDEAPGLRRVLDEMETG